MKDGSNGIYEVDLSGFQTVQSYYFSRTQMPSMSICKTSIQFNLQAVETLQHCESVKMFVNREKQQILIQPAHTQSKDSFCWTNSEAKSNKPPKLECPFFVRQLHEAWDWNPNYRYKTVGRLVHSEAQVMLLFDFTEYEIWDGYSQLKGIGTGLLQNNKSEGK